MSQQINLFNPALRPKKEYLSAGLMARVIAGFMVLLCAYGGYLNQRSSRLAIEREEWAKQVQVEQANLMQVVQQYPAHQPSKALRDEIVATEEKIYQREKVFEILNSGTVGVGGGFSGLMQAFAHQSVNGLWLTGFSANGAGDQMRISGRALSPDLIPEYIGRLSEEAVLRGRAFTGLQVSQPASSPAPALPANQQKPLVAALPAFVEFALSADRVAEKPSEKADGATAVGKKS